LAIVSGLQVSGKALIGDQKRSERGQTRAFQPYESATRSAAKNNNFQVTHAREKEECGLRGS
jgi:hypothetical protein